MITKLFRKIFFRRKKYKSLNPDEVFLDSSNLPSFNRDQFEGRIELPIARGYLIALKVLFSLAVILFISRAFFLQVAQGEFFRERSERNTLRKEMIFAHRGIIYDRNGELLAWNEEDTESGIDKRRYIDSPGFGLLLGYVKYPKKDSKGNFYSYYTEGQDGAEKFFDEDLRGENGATLTEVSVHGDIESQSVLDAPKHGESKNLSIDARVQAKFQEIVQNAVEVSGFNGGAGVVMDIHTGEVLAATSYPEFDSEAMTEGIDEEVNAYLQSKRQPFLERVTSGLYAPGSIVKPFIALGILAENIISPERQIESTGALTLPNPYNPDRPTIFKDWKAHGFTDLREAIAVSSDVYFYVTGGGFGGQKGLGITKIDEYISKFLLGVPTTGFFAGPSGTIPTPEWKAKTFDGEAWTLGNTYHSSIGQYGFQVTPLQMARATGGIATKGTLVEPVIEKGEEGKKTSIDGISAGDYEIVKEGMRLAVTNGTAIALNIPEVKVGAKTGTAEVGSSKSRVNSWVIGFFPYDNPKYAFAVVLENGPSVYSISAMQIGGKLIRWMVEGNLEYVK